MNTPQDILRLFSFKGRIGRKEYALIILGMMVVGWTLVAVDMILGSGEDRPFVFASLYWLVAIIPFYASTVRRIHDLNRTGWWVLPMALIPLLNIVLLISLMIRKGDVGSNRYGADPLETRTTAGSPDFRTEA